MVIEKLTLSNFKNYDQAQFSFSPALNLITGLNGSGKTNLLDAIHYISITKSAFNISDVQNIYTGRDFFSILATISQDTEHHLVSCSLMKGERKIIKFDKAPYTRSSDHIGKIPSVLITPYDTDIIRAGSQERRRFFDTLISQIDANFLKDLIEYTQAVKQRNAALKIFNETKKTDLNLIEFFDLKIIDLGSRIYQKRKSFLSEFVPVFISYYKQISEDLDQVSLLYKSHLDNDNFTEEFKNVLHQDIAMQRTTKGVHRDDFIFGISGNSLKNFGSQGQQKSFVIALKIAQFQVLKEKKGFSPLLLLDDIFDKLDDRRITELLQLVSSGMFGQIFMTDASLERLYKYTSGISSEMSIFKIEKGILVS